MSIRHASHPNALRPTPLLAALALALSMNLSVATAAESSSAALEWPPIAPPGALAAAGGARGAAWQSAGAQRPPGRPATTLVVTNCNDAGPGSLRQALGSAVNGDTIDLTTLGCSRITLTTGALSIAANDLRLDGPGARVLTLDGGASASHPHGVVDHFGGGQLAIADLTITGGFYTGATFPKGACIYSRGSVYLRDSVVTGCTVRPTTSTAGSRGGAVYTLGQLVTKYSAISGNAVYADAGWSAVGGAAFANAGLVAKYSTFSDNRAIAEGTARGNAGGLGTRGDVTITGSTISGNYASRNNCALEMAGSAGTSASISNSTISGNVAGNVNSGVFTSVPLTLRNSTIAFNRAGTADCMPLYGYPSCDAGLHVRYASANVQSTIIARNSASGAPADISLVGPGTITGVNNLVIAPHVAMPPGTIFADPKLYPLANNGGPTRTHALRPGSAAIDAGNNEAGLGFDQRREGYARVVGANADIGAFERQGADDPDYVFIDAFDGI